MKKNKESIFKKWWFWLFAIIIFMIIIPFSINWLFKQSFGIEWLAAEWTAGEALTYYGTILGAGATIWAVRHTIISTRKDQTNIFKMELEKERLEKWRSEAKELFEGTAIAFATGFFIQSIKGINLMNSKEKIMVIDNKKDEMDEVYLKFNWFFTAAPMADYGGKISKLSKEICKFIVSTHNEWIKVADASVEYCKLYEKNYSNNATNEKKAEAIESIKEWGSKIKNYNDYYASISAKFRNYMETLKGLIDEELLRISKGG